MSHPARIGRYEVVGRLATGGMAEIFLARITGPTGFERPVVIKRILPHLARQRQFREMFLDEARIVARIRHPAVVNVHELGEEGGELYLVLEYLEGETLSNLGRALRSVGRKLDYALATYIVAEACAGLHAAHELLGDDGAALGLVHRDVSAQNIFVNYSGQVKVLDFGIATAADRISRTEAGQVKGKFEYMSPEQCQGRPLDRRSDIFALGIVAYEISTGHRLFRRPTQLATLQAIVGDPVAPPSHLVPGYPASLDAICMRALARPVDERYATAADMRRDLLGVLRELETGSHEEPGAKLAAVMQETFAERIGKKREMLRRVGTGSEVTHIPSDHLDEDIDVSSVVGELGTAEGSAIDDHWKPSRRRRRRGLPWVVRGGVLLAIVAAAVVGYRFRSAAVPVTASPAVLVPAPVITAAVASDEAPRPPPTSSGDSTVTIRVDSKPPGARVLVDGVERGVTPASLALPRAAASVALELQRPGFAPTSQSIVPDQDQRLLLVLEVQPRGAAPARAGSPTKPAPSGSAFWKFE